MKNWQERTILLLGEDKVAKFAESHVLVAGLGGVGAYVAELLCRAGVGVLTIIDGDRVEPSNRNRQLPAFKSTEKRWKTEVVAERLKDINPDIQLNVICEFIRDERTKEILSEKYDFVVDAIDSLSPKVHLIAEALNNGFKIISSMGAGGKIDPSLVRISNIEDSYNCPLARMVRKRLHKLGIREGLRVVFSPEKVIKANIRKMSDSEKSPVGTISYMPAIFGCFCASEVIKSLKDSPHLS